MLNYIYKNNYICHEMEIKNIYISLSAIEFSDRLAGFFSAKGSGRYMYFNVLKCKL